MAKPKAQKTYQLVKPTGDEWERKAIKVTFSLYDRDLELIQQLEKFLGSNQSDALRTAIRLAYAQLVKPQ